MPSADQTLSVGSEVIQPVTVVRDLGVYLDNELTMKQHIRRVVSFFQLRRLRQICRSAGEEVTKRLVTALLHYFGLLQRCTRRPSRVDHQTVAACTERRCSSLTPSQVITPVLRHLHWLLIKSRILYKLCLLMHLIHTNQRPAYMAEMVENSNIFVAVWPPVCQPPPVPDASAENQVR